MRRLWTAFDDFWTPSALSDRMKDELRVVAHDDAIADRVIAAHEGTRRRVRRRQRSSFVTYSLMSLGAGMFLGVSILSNLGPIGTATAVVALFSIVLIVLTYVTLAVLHWPTQRRHNDRLCIDSATAAGRCSEAVVNGVDAQWRRRVADGVGNTAESFRRRYRRLFLAAAAPVNRTTTKLSDVGRRAILTVVERALVTDNMAALRDDLWRLHLRVMSADFDGVLQLRYADGVMDESRGWDHPRITMARVILGAPVVITALDGLMRLIWGQDASLSQWLSPATSSSPSPSVLP